MIKKRRTVYILLLLAGLLSLGVYLSSVCWPSQGRERPTLIYFYAGG